MYLGEITYTFGIQRTTESSLLVRGPFHRLEVSGGIGDGALSGPPRPQRDRHGRRFARRAHLGHDARRGTASSNGLRRSEQVLRPAR